MKCLQCVSSCGVSISRAGQQGRAGRQPGEPRQLESTLTDRRIPRLAPCLCLSVCLATSISMSTICCRVRLRVCLSPSVATFGAEATLLPAGEGSLSAFVAQYKLNLALAKEEGGRKEEDRGCWQVVTDKGGRQAGSLWPQVCYSNSHP